jgi:ankyrin repeat protein
MHYISLDCSYCFDPVGMTDVLIAAGADVNASDRRDVTPVMFAAGSIAANHIAAAILERLANSGAKFGVKDKNRRTLRSWVRGKGPRSGSMKNPLFEEMVGAIERAYRPYSFQNAGRGKDKARKRRTGVALLIAVFCGSERQIISAIESGADVNSKTKGRYTPLMFASVFSTCEAVKLLIRRGADVNARNILGETALSLAFLRDQSNPEIARALIEACADVNAANNEGYTPLMLAASADATGEISKILLDAGADARAKRNGGGDALSISLERKHFGVARMLLAAGAELGPAQSARARPDDDDDDFLFDADIEENDGKSAAKTAAALRRYGLSADSAGAELNEAMPDRHSRRETDNEDTPSMD